MIKILAENKTAKRKELVSIKSKRKKHKRQKKMTDECKQVKRT